MHFADNLLKKIVSQDSGYYIYILLTDYPDKVSKSLKRLGFWRYSHVSVSTSLFESDFYSYVGKKGFRIEQPVSHPTFRGEPVGCALYAIPVTKEVCESATKQITRRRCGLIPLQLFRACACIFRNKTQTQKTAHLHKLCLGDAAQQRSNKKAPFQVACNTGAFSQTVCKKSCLQRHYKGYAEKDKFHKGSYVK